MLDTSHWKFFALEDLFDIHYGVNLEYINCTPAEPTDENSVNFVSRSAVNCGVTGRVQIIDGIQPEPAGAITIAGGGSVLSTFLQREPFYSGRDLYVCISKKELTEFQKLFLCTLINKEAYRYAYGRQANRTLTKLMIKLPTLSNGTPNFEYMEDYMKNLSVFIPTSKNDTLNHNINVSNWKFFRVGDLFRLEIGKNKSQENLPSGEGYYYLGAKKLNNGVMLECGYDENLMSKGNCIVFICNGQGSVGYTNYMDREFIATADLVMGYNKNLNPYIGMFLVTILDKERPKYSFGRKWKTHLADTQIKLPATPTGEPDWQYMEDYIKSLPYGDCI